MEPKHRLVVGILGGMGPAATVDLFQKILDLTPAGSDEEHLNIQVDCNPHGSSELSDLPQRAARLEQIGAEIIAMPCNTAHIWYDVVQGAVRIPVVNMIRETAKAAAAFSPRPRAVGVLAYPPTLEAGIYADALTAQGITPVVPPPEVRQALYDLIHAVKGACVTPEIKAKVVRLGEDLIARGAEAIILGCTELPLTLSQADFSVPVLDATLVLARVTVTRALAGG
jgi:aspartate racemase